MTQQDDTAISKAQSEVKVSWSQADDNFLNVINCENATTFKKLFYLFIERFYALYLEQIGVKKSKKGYSGVRIRIRPHFEAGL